MYHLEIEQLNKWFKEAQPFFESTNLSKQNQEHIYNLFALQIEFDNAIAQQNHAIFFISRYFPQAGLYGFYQKVRNTNTINEEINLLKFAQYPPNHKTISAIIEVLKSSKFNTFLEKLEIMNKEQPQINETLARNVISGLKIMQLEKLPNSATLYQRKFIFINPNKLYFGTQDNLTKINLTKKDSKILYEKLKNNNPIDTQWILSRLNSKTHKQIIEYLINYNAAILNFFKMFNYDFHEKFNHSKYVNLIDNIILEQNTDEITADVNFEEQIIKLIEQVKLSVQQNDIVNAIKHFRAAKELSLSKTDPEKTKGLQLLYQEFYIRENLKNIDQHNYRNNYANYILWQLKNNYYGPNAIFMAAARMAPEDIWHDFKSLYPQEHRLKDQQTLEALEKFFNLFINAKNTSIKSSHSPLKTNSTGIQKMIEVINKEKNKDIPEREKIANINIELKHIAKQALAKSRLRVQFWHGRTNGADFVYKFLQNNDLDSLEQIKELNKNLNGKTLVHNSDSYQFNSQSLAEIYGQDLAQAIIGKNEEIVQEKELPISHFLKSQNP